MLLSDPSVYHEAEKDWKRWWVKQAKEPIAPEDSRLLGATFGRLSEESRYRRFFTTKDNLSAAELEYFVDIANSDHEAIVAINPSVMRGAAGRSSLHSLARGRGARRGGGDGRR